MGGRDVTPPSLDGRASPVLLWTPDQRKIIDAAASKRLLVDAGPGTGKTATACARIASILARGDVDATEVWLLSFTRTAVHELRNRIAAYLPDGASAAALRITTIDAHAWAIYAGFDEHATITGDFDDSVRRASELVRSHEGVFGYVSAVRHLVVDEAQDIVGTRCELVLELIHALPANAGVSVFADEAQAIYGFSEDGAGPSAFDGNLPDKIREFLGDQFSEIDLAKLHRTSDSTLAKLFSRGRTLMRDTSIEGRARLEAVRQLVLESNHGAVGPYWNDVKTLTEDDFDTLLLFRRRGEALAASGNLDALPHRIRISGLPRCIHGWIVVLLWDWTRPDLDVSDFMRLWAERLGQPEVTQATQAWALLVRFFGRTEQRISVSRLVARLASSPPYELVHTEFGSSGPIFGTIHGSKGREAEDVRLFLPGLKKGDAEIEGLDEEARIVFVGATRARKSLLIGSSSSMVMARRLEPSGRSFTPYPYAKGGKEAKAAVEVGSGRDVDALGLVGRELYPDASEAHECQRRIMALAATFSTAKAEATDEEHHWRFRLSSGDSEHLCYLHPSLGHDLFSIARFVDQLVELGFKRLPRQIRHLRLFGVRTLALAPGDPLREQLHAPWRESGLIAAPMLLGYPMVYFR